MVLTLPIETYIPVDEVFTVRFTPAKIGVGATLELGYELRRRGFSRVLLVSGKTVYERTDVCKRVISAIESEGIEVYVWNEAEPEPSVESIERGLTRIKDLDFDAIVAVGGGSSIDTAKLMNLCASHPVGSVLEYFPPPIGGGKVIPGPLRPLIAVPTTAGSGSETSPTAVISVPKYCLKVGISHEYLLPTLAIVDPVNALTSPPSVTAAAGLDALMHAIEAYTARPYNTRPKPSTAGSRPVYIGSNPVTDALAEKAIELIGKYLRRAVHNGYDMSARLNMSIAAYMAGIALANAGTHISHAISLVLGGVTKAAHGVCAALTGPALLKHISPVMYEKLAKIASLLGEDVHDLQPRQAALKSVDALKKLMADVGVPNGLKALGISESDIPAIAEKTMVMQRLLAQSPVRVSKEVIESILKESITLW